jgi:phosphohistidine phosphatase
MITVEPQPSRILLMRHARSAWAEPGGRDFDRPLDEQGFAEAEIVTALAADRRYRPDLVLSSTALRCRQTADAARRAFGEDCEMLFVDELYNGSVEIYLEMLATQKQAQTVMLIGHNPRMEEVLQALIGDDRTAAAIPAGYPTAGLAVLDHGGSVIAAAGTWLLSDFFKS